MKGIIFFLLLTASAATTFAAGEGIEVASIDRNLQLQNGSRVVAPLVDEKFEYYEVKGDREKELCCQLKQNGCRGKDGKKYDAVTSWHVKWDYDYDRGAQACTPDSFRVSVEIIFRYPKWSPSENTPRPLVDKWERYMKNLIRHESGHRDIVVEAADELSRAVAGLPPAPTCADIDREVRALCRVRMEKLNAAQKEYDAATNHGASQGALFQ